MIRENLIAKVVREIIDSIAPKKKQLRPPESIFTKTANRYLALLRQTRPRKFTGNFKDVAYQVSDTIRHDGELVEIAEILEQQAAIREVYNQRQKSSS